MPGCRGAIRLEGGLGFPTIGTAEEAEGSGIGRAQAQARHGYEKYQAYGVKRRRRVIFKFVVAGRPLAAETWVGSSPRPCSMLASPPALHSFENLGVSR